MCGTCGKIFLIVLNVAFLVAGATLAALGIIALVKEDLLYEITSLVTDSLSKVIDNVDKIAQIDIAGIIMTNAIILLIVGAILLIMGVLGVCGAMKMNGTMLKIYGIIILVILMAEIGLGVYAYMYSDKFENELQNGLRLAMYKTYKNGLREQNVPGVLNASQAVQEYGMDSLQLELQCCGITNNSEWDSSAAEWNATYWSSSLTIPRAYYPPSCCILNDTRSKEAGFLAIPITHFRDLMTCMTSEVSNNVHTTPCYERMKSIITDNQDIIIITLVIIVAIEVLAVICACFLVGQSSKVSVS